MGLAVTTFKTLPHYEAEARERQRLTSGDHGNQYIGGKVVVTAEISLGLGIDAHDMLKEALCRDCVG